MNAKELTHAEVLLLGLVAEMPRHGYELERVIGQRGMREWTQIGFSSIYYSLGKLEAKGYLKAGRPASARSKKVYELTRAGRKQLVDTTLATLRSVEPAQPALLLGMIHWAVLTREQALGALQARKAAVAEEIARVEGIQFEQQPLPDYVDAAFDFTIGQLQAEARWIDKTHAYMATKPWNE